jgi:hypothetical protein
MLTLVVFHNNLFAKEALIDKYIGMFIDNKKIICCAVQQKKQKYQTIKSTISATKNFIKQQKAKNTDSYRLFSGENFFNVCFWD